MLSRSSKVIKKFGWLFGTTFATGSFAAQPDGDCAQAGGTIRVRPRFTSHGRSIAMQMIGPIRFVPSRHVFDKHLPGGIRQPSHEPHLDG